MNISEWVSHCGEKLAEAQLHFGHGTDNAFDEALWLVLHSAGEPLDGSFDDWQRDVDTDKEQRIFALLDQRISTRKPLAYLIGSAWFAGLEFAVNEHVLVPRSPIAELIIERFSPWVDAGKVHHVLDLCTGSGCIAVAAAVAMPDIQVDAVDISETALQVAAENLSRHAVANRVRLVQSDLFEGLAGKRYDLIVTNPPYVAKDGTDRLPDEYLAEPELGLFSGTDGLDLCLRILAQADSFMHPDGVLVCEVGESADRLNALLPGVPFLWLEFETGGEGVFLLDRDELVKASAQAEALIKERSCVG